VVWDGTKGGAKVIGGDTSFLIKIEPLALSLFPAQLFFLFLNFPSLAGLLNEIVLLSRPA